MNQQATAQAGIDHYSEGYEAGADALNELGFEGARDLLNEKFPPPPNHRKVTPDEYRYANGYMDAMLSAR